MGDSFQVSPINVAFVVTALFFNTMTAPLVKLTQNATGGYDYNKWCVYFFSEFIKLVVAVLVCLLYHPKEVTWRSIEVADFLQYAGPGFVFFAQNNLSFLALQHMDSSAFQLLMNTRIISVAILSVLLLRKSLNTVEWVSIVLLMVGAMQYQLSGASSSGCDVSENSATLSDPSKPLPQSSYRIDATGVFIMLVIVLCAAGGNVYTQKVMQRKYDQPLMKQNAYLYVWGVAFNGVNWSLSVGRGAVAFGDVRFIQIFSMLFYAVYGLSISVILKRFGAITRTFINTAAIVFTAFVDVFAFNSSISVLEMTTFVVIMLAVFSHTVLAKHHVPATNVVSASDAAAAAAKSAGVVVGHHHHHQGVPLLTAGGGAKV